MCGMWEAVIWYGVWKGSALYGIREEGGFNVLDDEYGHDQ
jgi:hypothetical protein